MKKFAFLGLIIAPAAIILPMEVDASSNTYVVKSGDSLSKIASQHKMSVNELMKLNQLSTDKIYVGQQLLVSGVDEKQKGKLIASTKKSSVAVPAMNTSVAREDVVEVESQNQLSYQVVSGDTLSKIATKFGVSIANVKLWNNLQSDLIYVGQKLSIKGGIVTEVEAEVDLNDLVVALADRQIEQQLAKETAIVNGPNEAGQALYMKVLEVANLFIGVPYLFGGNTPDGFDCSGYINYVFSNSGMSIIRKSSLDYFLYDTTKVENPVPGDVVFFKNTYMAGISHMGIYLGNDTFIHAGTKGVEVSKLSYDYWKDRFVGFKRFNHAK